ncbi:hypothetical protein [Spirosoma foliorum]|uniref:Lipocalin-like domain-containing protein n=1 Tax=Spirosoma foliorum TaxID=2710596 RepID=A0A7G5H2X4_9BACT|nr:hypothetical protein [Spirosoma foliorum]QMW05466.1 hypothetical protein H3H32_11535 [Spirosoma foliorum]
MKKVTILLFISFYLISSCTQSISPTTVFDVVGSYELTEYQTTSLIDETPTGTVSITQVDNQHVNILVKGTSGKTKINYSYSNVTVVAYDKEAYSLQYKGKQIGLAGNDGISRYVSLYPTTTITIQAVEF